MKLYNINNHNEQVSFCEAVIKGLGSNKGLFFPENLPIFSDKEISDLLEMDFINRSAKILYAYLHDEIPFTQILNFLKIAFNFSVPVVKINHNISILELFHGPTLAFKDFGCRFLAQIIPEITNNKLTIILTATSGDTGAAVANAFHNIDNIKVIILYPYKKISIFQEQLICNLGNNIYPLAVEGNFDDCQYLVKEAFDDKKIKKSVKLNSANSINIGRLLAQICYYFEGVSKIPIFLRKKLVVSVPCGNFGNLMAGLLAKSLGLPIKRLIVATNVNNTVPRYLKSGKWSPQPTISTISNSMDISTPNNWPRIKELFLRKDWKWNLLGSGAVSDKETCETIREVNKSNYITEPHTAISYRVLKNKLQDDEFGLCISTAHPVKFLDTIEKILGKKISINSEKFLFSKNCLSKKAKIIPANLNDLRKVILSLN